jgi:hypothetical protein
MYLTLNYSSYAFKHKTPWKNYYYDSKNEPLYLAFTWCLKLDHENIPKIKFQYFNINKNI